MDRVCDMFIPVSHIEPNPEPYSRESMVSFEYAWYFLNHTEFKQIFNI